MASKVLASVAALAVIAAGTAARASPDRPVDRDRLRKAAVLPSVGPRGWYFVTGANGRVYEGSEEPRYLDVVALRGRLTGDDSDVDRWADLAAAYRLSLDAAQEKECLAHVAAIRRRLASAHADDGVHLAALALALVGAGDDAGADDAVRRAEQASKNAWAGTAAAADLVVLRTAGKAAARRFADVDEVRAWVAEETTRPASFDADALAAAAQRYDAAVAGLEKAGATGPAAAGVLVRRTFLRECLPHGAGDADARAAAWADESKTLRLLPSDPFAITMLALEDAMSPPQGPEGARLVQSFDRLTEAARAKLTADVERLQEIASSADHAAAARAHHGIACIDWFVHRDAEKTELELRTSIALDAEADPSWSAAVLQLSQLQRWDDLATWCKSWVGAGETPRRRMLLAKALSFCGREADAEEQWRAAQSLDPSGFDANLGLAVCVLRRAKDDADLKKAAELLDAAEKAVPAATARKPFAAGEWDIADAVRRGLAGDVEGAEKAARRAIERYGDQPATTEILAALGR